MKTRILIAVSRLLEGGIDTVLVEYLKHFDRTKYSVTLAIGVCMEELEKHIAQVPRDVLVEYLVRAHWLVKYRKRKVQGKLSLPAKLADEAFLNPLRRTLQRRRLHRLMAGHDVLVDFDSSFYSFLSPGGLPKVAFFHFSFKRYHGGRQDKLLRLGRKLSVYDRIVTPCEAMKQEGEELYPHLIGRFHTVYNSFDLDALRARAAEGAVPPPPYLVSVERLEESQKDVTTLLRAYRLLVDRHGSPGKLHILGDGKSRPQLEALRAELGLEGEVCFEGFVPNPYPWVRASRLFVFSSKFEGFGNVLVEAMALGVPVVSTDCPTGPREILRDGKAGLLVPVGDAEALAEAMHRMLSDEELRRAILSEADRQVRRFDVRHTIREIENLITQAIEKR